VVDANADVETVYHRMWLALEGHAQGWSQNRAAGKS
jgi:hypothetical protein